MNPRRGITPADQQVLMLANQGAGNIVLTPITLNGEERVALAFYGQNAHGPFLRVLGVLLVPGDVVLDSEGQPTTPYPPGTEKDLN